ncbi:uncharacterized protein TNIN_205021 [Trichonephila inaurata madagascariensis]|uniref:Uncharacterized protein n=1 Tax=Trichonephila inaurata madagascariensis TaxID=2747483 RepID=A0A8X7CPN0_9ARAC|nr:uncharacterized protein TNIN_205021 [Trichonephila inaurata madagascariensis]
MQSSIGSGVAALFSAHVKNFSRENRLPSRMFCSNYQIPSFYQPHQEIPSRFPLDSCPNFLPVSDLETDPTSTSGRPPSFFLLNSSVTPRYEIRPKPLAGYWKLPSKFRRTQAFVPRSIPRLQRSPCRDLAAACAEMPHSFKHSLPDDEQDAFYVLSPLHPKRSFARCLLPPLVSHHPISFKRGRGWRNDKTHSYGGIVSQIAERKAINSISRIGFESNFDL